MSLWITCKNMHNKRKIRNGKRAGKMFDFPSEESWNIHIQAIKGRHMGQGCQAAIGTSLPPAPPSATLRYGENPTRHTQRVLRSFDGCLSHLLFYVPQTSRVNAPVPGIAHVSCSGEMGAAGQRVSQRWGKGLAAAQKLVASITLSPLAFLVNAKHIETKWHSSGCQNPGNKRSEAHICL